MNILITILTHSDHFSFLKDIWNEVKKIEIPKNHNTDFIVVTDSTAIIPDDLSKFIKKENIDLRIVNIPKEIINKEEKKVITRNFYRQIAINGNYDYLLNLDGDVKPPKDVLIKLIEADKDIIGGWTYNESQGGVLVYPNKIDYKEIYECVLGNTYCLLEKRDVFTNIPYSNLVGKPDDTKRQYDIRSNGYNIFVHPEVYCQHIESDYKFIPTTKNKGSLIEEFKTKNLPKNIERISDTKTGLTFKHGNRHTIIKDKKMTIKVLDAEFSILFNDNKEVSIYEKEPEILDNGKWYEPYILGREGNFEYDVILNEKPDTNKLEFDIDFKNVDFLFQPFLTEEEIDLMENKCSMFRPPEVEGSYAIYNKNKGKLFHIYRPKVYDSAGNQEWAEIEINVELKKLYIIVPQTFLNNAFYPVIVDPNFGYDTIGSAGTTTIADQIVGSIFAGQVGTGASITAYINPSSTSYTFKYAIYKESDLSLVTNGVTGEGTATSGADWRTLNFTTPPTLEAVNYILVACSNNLDYQTNIIYYDAGDVNQGYIDTEVYGTFPSTLSPTNNNNKYSIYITYNTVEIDTFLQAESGSLLLQENSSGILI